MGDLGMKTSLRLRPANSIIFVSDIAGGVVPGLAAGMIIHATPSCISVECYPEQDGPTKITLGDGDDVDPGGMPEFDGPLNVPNRVVAVSTVNEDAVLRMSVPRQRARIRIWINHRKWPDDIVIGVS